jgi:hypothetical protein
MKWLIVSIWLAAACGKVNPPFTDAGEPAEPPDGSTAAAPSTRQELVGAAGRLSSATYTFDVELGHAVAREPASGATHTLEQE